MSEIYSDANEKYVKTVVLYAKSSKLYTDAAKTIEVTHDEAMNACLKGTLVFDTDTYYHVSSFKDASGTLTITTTASSNNTFSVK